jgi:hypothetical protein
MSAGVLAFTAPKSMHDHNASIGTMRASGQETLQDLQPHT